MEGMCDLNEPRIERLSTPARLAAVFKVVGDTARDKNERTPRGMGPRLTH